MSRYSQFRRELDNLRAGMRDTLVAIEQRPSSDAVDDSGFPDDDANAWSTLAAEEWMHRHALGGQERFVRNQEAASVDTIWTMRYRDDMDPDLWDVAKLRRLRHEYRVHDIVSATVIGRKDGIELVTLSRIG